MAGKDPPSQGAWATPSPDKVPGWIFPQEGDQGCFHLNEWTWGRRDLLPKKEKWVLGKKGGS